MKLNLSERFCDSEFWIFTHAEECEFILDLKNRARPVWAVFSIWDFVCVCGERASEEVSERSEEAGEWANGRGFSLVICFLSTEYLRVVWGWTICFRICTRYSFLFLIFILLFY